MGRQPKSDYLFEKNNWDAFCLRMRGGHKIALFLDFDGTLIPIQKDHAQCFLSDRTKKQLSILRDSHCCYITIVSGRSLPDIRRRVGIRKIYYGGNHGLEISGQDMRYTNPEALKAKPVISSARRRLKREINGFEGTWLEDKTYTLSLHFRSVGSRHIPGAKKKFYDIAGEFLKKNLLTVIRGKKVLELVPDVAWNKGKAVSWILRRFENGCLPIYVGDDQTDETAFKYLHKKGITVRVGKSKTTSAVYYIKGYWEVSRLLDQMRDLVGR
jgi:trehalose-phosphatase